MYVNSLACIRIKGSENEVFQDREWCETRLYHVPLALQCIYGWSDERGENEDGSEIFGVGGRVEII